MRTISIVIVLLMLSSYSKSQELFNMPDDVRTRWSSPENPNAEKGKAGLVNFVPQGWSPRQMAGMLRELIKREYIIRNIAHEPYCLRVSTGFYNTEEELVGFRDALGEILKMGPEKVKIPEIAMDLSDEPVWVEEMG